MSRSASQPLRSVAPSAVCVALAADTTEGLFARAAAAVQDGEHFLELRLDALPHPGDGIEELARFRVWHPQATLLATCRTRAGGGSFDGPVEDQLWLLAAAARAGAHLVDVELETLAAADPERLAALRAALDAEGTGVVVSAHDFVRTGDLQATLKRLETLGAPLVPVAYKVVTTATALADNLRMLQFLQEASARLPVVGICMGEAGVVSRILALRAGAAFTFSAAEDGQGTAPGQIAARALRQLYRADRLTALTKMYGIIGNPVTHSLSPVLHNAGFAAAGLDAVYLPLHTTSVEDVWEMVEGLPLAGLSVTMPWKTEILPRLGGIDPEAARIGAVNTVVRQTDGTLFGSNTDVAAIVEPLEQHLPLKGVRALIVGAGGAARAAVFGLRARGAEVSILNRSRTNAERLALESGSHVADADRLGRYDVVVNATPAGMAGGPLRDSLAVAPEALDGARLVFEMVYRPFTTPLTKLARSRGIAVISGLQMFLHQGVRQWELWTGQTAPWEAMEAALTTASANETAPPTSVEGEDHGRI